MIALIMVAIFFTVLLWSHFMCCFHESTTNVLVLEKRGTSLLKKKGASVLKKPVDDFEVILSFDADSFSESNSTCDLLIFFLKGRNVPGQHKKYSTVLETKSEPCFYYCFDDEDEIEVAPRLIKSETIFLKRH